MINLNQLSKKMKKIIISILSATIILSSCQSVEPLLTNEENNRGQNTQIFLVAIDDNGARGDKIGCNDSLVAVDLMIPETESILAKMKYTIDSLLSQSGPTDPQTELYNSLYQSELKIQNISISENQETVSLNLVGQASVGGVCDVPRFQEQIKKTIREVDPDTIKNVEVSINGQAMEEYFSAK